MMLGTVRPTRHQDKVNDGPVTTYGPDRASPSCPASPLAAAMARLGSQGVSRMLGETFGVDVRYPGWAAGAEANGQQSPGPM